MTEEQLIITIARKTIGLYGKDQYGRAWATYCGAGKQHCAMCGDTIVSGWTAGIWADNQTYICRQHGLMTREPGGMK